MMISSEKPLTLNTYLSWKWCEYIYLQTINQYSLLCLGACVGGITPMYPLLLIKHTCFLTLQNES